MITVDSRGVNMTLINESIISLLRFWPLAMLLIKPSAGAAPTSQGGGAAAFCTSQQADHPSRDFSISISLTLETKIRLRLLIRLSSKTSLVFGQRLSFFCRNIEKLGWKVRDEHCHIFTRWPCRGPHRPRDAAGPCS